MKCTNKYDRYFKHDEITSILQSYAEKYPRYVQLVSLNKTIEQRDIWLLKITDTNAGMFDEKPAYCALGPVHAQEVMGTMAVMYYIDYLLTNKDEQTIKRLLEDYTIYAIPNPTPDGTECYLTTPEILRSVNFMYPYNELQKGLQMKDMDGDGVIRQMRFKDKLGPWKISDEDERMMIPRKPDETEGEFYQVFREGYFEGEGDWRDFANNAPEKWGLDLNRNWPIGWRPEALQKGAGTYPIQSIENKTLADFFAKQKNVCVCLIYHTSAGVFFYPPSYISPKDVPKEDIDRYKAVLAMGTEEMGYPVRNVYETFCEKQGMFAAGSLDDYLHFGLGIFASACELWDLETKAGIPGKWDRLPALETGNDKYGYELKTLRWIDENIGKDAFKPWAKYEHPQLGEVEIGGFDYKFVVVNCPTRFLEIELQKACKFMLRETAVMPKIELDTIKVEKVREKIYKIEATVLNRRFLPTYVTKAAENLKLTESIKAEIKGDCEIISGEKIQEIGQLPGMSGIKHEHHFTNYVMPPSPSIRKNVSWILKANEGTEITIKAYNQKAGRIEKSVKLYGKEEAYEK